ncbi:MAG: nucleotidyltransferase domain-containing protein [Candidatus Aenigmarchaeota archaeon]|nr:nucleotidyltransferase domain-containing protein [Candidatus Aenigmarchaeota archaeon]
MNYELLAYAMDFVSFVVSKLGKDSDKIKSVMLFGSVSRGEATKKSDIDIFVDVFGKEKTMEEGIKKIGEEFYKSVKFTRYWKLIGIENEIKPVIGKLDEWKDLKSSIFANGIILYGKYKEVPDKPKGIVLLWENIKPQSRRVSINKQIFGYKHYRKKYSGLLEKYNGMKLAKGAIEIPIESYPAFMKIFRKYKISVKIKYVMG